MKNLDQLTKEISAFDSFQDLIDAKGCYYPSLRCKPCKNIPSNYTAKCQELANAYDKAQAERGDHRRAYRI